MYWIALCLVVLCVWGRPGLDEVGDWRTRTRGGGHKLEPLPSNKLQRTATTSQGVSSWTSGREDKEPSSRMRGKNRPRLEPLPSDLEEMANLADDEEEDSLLTGKTSGLSSFEKIGQAAPFSSGSVLPPIKGLGSSQETISFPVPKGSVRRKSSRRKKPRNTQFGSMLSPVGEASQEDSPLAIRTDDIGLDLGGTSFSQDSPDLSNLNLE